VLRERLHLGAKDHPQDMAQADAREVAVLENKEKRK
jgi:hypothetical protein